MRIAIIGTYGIPNRHGGFERFAEEVSVRLAGRGNEVTVYNPSNHPYRESNFRNVMIVIKYFPHFMGAAAPLFFDLFCLRHAIRSGAEVILQCGYTSSAWLPLLPGRKTKKIITHMDGMEWKRAKWGRLTKKFIRWTEKLAVKYSDAILADHPVIQKYYRGQYGVEAKLVGYGVQEVQSTGFKVQGPEVSFRSSRFRHHSSIPGEGYILIIARLEPENNPEMMIGGFLLAETEQDLLVVGDTGTRYGKRLARKYGSEKKVHFAGAIYEREELDVLRKNCNVYIHGHSVGGTNPSLLEAMAFGCTILAHDNPYNREVLGDRGQYFRDKEQLAELIQKAAGTGKKSPAGMEFHQRNNWEKVVGELESVMRKT